MISYPLGAGGVVTRVLESGAGPDAAVLLHGIGARADRFVRNVGALAPQLGRVLALDFPGHGFASKDDRTPATVPRLAEFVVAALDAADVPRATLIGTSLGGHVSATIACNAPQRVDKLVLVGTLGISPLAPERCERMRSNVRDTSREGIRKKLSSVLHDESLVTDEWVDEEYRANNSPGAAAALGRLADYLADDLNGDLVGEALADRDDRPETLLIWGANDRSVPLEDAYAAQALLGAPLAIIEDAAHVPYFEHAETFNELVATFVSGESLDDLRLPGLSLRSSPQA